MDGVQMTVAAARQAKSIVLQGQLPQAMRQKYQKVALEHGSVIRQAEDEFRKRSTENKGKVAEGFKGGAADAALESLGHLADKREGFFTDGVVSVKQGILPLFGLPR